jgi:hypothetical protein
MDSVVIKLPIEAKAHTTCYTLYYALLLCNMSMLVIVCQAVWVALRKVEHQVIVVMCMAACSLLLLAVHGMEEMVLSLEVAAAGKLLLLHPHSIASSRCADRLLVWAVASALANNAMSTAAVLVVDVLALYRQLLLMSMLYQLIGTSFC